jgi:hypothetical protein
MRDIMSEQETLDFTPVHHITNTLLGLVDVQQPGYRKRIKRIWLDDTVPRIILEGAGQSPAAFSIQFVLQADSEHYVLLEPPETWWDPEEGKAPQGLIRVESPGTLEFIAPELLSSLIPKLIAAIKSRGNLQAADYQAALRKDAESAFGKLPLKGSAEYKAQVPGEEGLIRDMSINFNTVEPGTALRISKRWNDFGTPYIALTDESGKETEFSIRWIVNHEDSKYLVLLYPPDLTAEDNVIPKIVVRFIDQDHVQTLNADEFDEVVLACFTEMGITEKCSAEQATELLGELLSWQEAKAGWDKK